jgi:hypothetical protein
MAQTAYDGWKADMLAGKVTLMAAADGTNVTALSTSADASAHGPGARRHATHIPRGFGRLAGTGSPVVG